jgi:AcrR family transcriptional regulator
MSEPKQTKSLKRGRGRPKSFDRTAAIQQAMVLFWDRGYEGTTFDDLIGAMKLSPSSFYHEFGSKEQLYREAVDHYFNLSSRHLRGFSSHRDTRAAFEALIEEAAAFFTNDASPAGCMISLAGTHLPPHLRSVADYTKSLRKLFEEALARRLRKGFRTVICPRKQTLKNSLPISTPFFADWLSGHAMARRENNFWRFAEWQCELGLQDLHTRITKRITRVAPGAASPDVHLTSCRVLLSLSKQHAADTRPRQRVFWRATSLTPLVSPHLWPVQTGRLPAQAADAPRSDASQAASP